MFDSIPVEIISIILLKIKKKFLLRLILVNSTFHNIIYCDKLYQKIKFGKSIDFTKFHSLSHFIIFQKISMYNRDLISMIKKYHMSDIFDRDINIDKKKIKKIDRILDLTKGRFLKSNFTRKTRKNLQENFQSIYVKSICKKKFKNTKNITK